MRILTQPLVNSCQLCLKRRCVSRSVLAGGALPVVDGFVAAFDGPTGVLLASYALKPLLRTRARHVHTCPKSVSSRRSPAARLDDYIP
jgi:hypothetical protein